MDIQTILISTFSSTILIAILTWLLKNWISIRLSSSVAHEFNKKIEDFRSELRIKEEEIKQDLNSKGKSIELIHSGVFNQAISRNNQISSKKIEAIEELWQAVHELASQKMAVKLVQSIDLDYATANAKNDQKIRDFFSTLNKTCKVNNVVVTAKVNWAKLYVSEISWAFYSAYTSIIFYTMTRMIIIENGVGNIDVIKTGDIIKMTKIALPNQIEFIDKHGVTSIFHLVDEIEKKLMDSLKRDLTEINTSESMINQAKEIILLSEEAINQINLSKYKN